MSNSVASLAFFAGYVPGMYRQSGVGPRSFAFGQGARIDHNNAVNDLSTCQNALIASNLSAFTFPNGGKELGVMSKSGLTSNISPNLR